MKSTNNKQRNPSGFRSTHGRNKFYAAYETTLRNWPVKYKTVNVSTSFGQSHVIISGSENSPSLVLFSAAGLSGTLWIHNISELSKNFQVFVVDIIVEPGKSIQISPLTNRTDAGRWIVEILDGLGLVQPFIGGISFGGWLSLNFALFAPKRIKKLILMSPAASFEKFRKRILISLKLGRFQWIFPQRFTKASLNLLTEKPENLNSTFVDQFGIGIKEYRYPKNSVFPSVFTDEELASLRCPTLLLIGEKEVIYDPHKALERAESLIPQVTSILVSDAGHLLNVDQPILLDQYLREFSAKK